MSKMLNTIQNLFKRETYTELNGNTLLIKDLDYYTERDGEINAQMGDMPSRKWGISDLGNGDIMISMPCEISSDVIDADLIYDTMIEYQGADGFLEIISTDSSDTTEPAFYLLRRTTSRLIGDFQAVYYLHESEDVEKSLYEFIVYMVEDMDKFLSGLEKVLLN